MVLAAMFIIAAPPAMAQTPVADQYQSPVGPDDGGAAPADDEGGAAPAEDAGAPVQVRQATAAQVAGLPFTGGQISLIALIGLGLLAAGAVGLAASRRRASSARP